VNEVAVENYLQPILAGFIAGFIVAVPVGPVNLTVINQALRRGFFAAFLIGVGAMCAETVYASLMLWGHASILNAPSVVRVMRFIAVVVIGAMGIRYLLFKSTKVGDSEVAAQKLDERWHHPRSFFLGFALTISNLMLVVVWATVVTLLFAHEWVVPTRASRLLCALGVLGGGSMWFLLLAFFVSRAHRRVKDQTLTILVRCCGVLFLGFAGLLAWKLFRS
jgi:threonine/homoserine/homoserine lactone efflux protein